MKQQECINIMLKYQKKKKRQEMHSSLNAIREEPISVFISHMMIT